MLHRSPIGHAAAEREFLFAFFLLSRLEKL